MKILIIDEKLSRRTLLQKALESENCCVDVSSDGERGSYLARTNNFDFVLLSTDIQKRTPIQICVDLRAAGKSTFLVVYSKSKATEDRIQLYLAGADEVLPDPFEFRELIVRLRTLLRRGPLVHRDTLQVGRLRLDPQTYNVWCGSRKIFLNGKAFAILEILMRNAGNLVTRATIMEKVWAMEIDPSSHTIDSTVSVLRQRIGRCGVRIRNIRGRGFILE